MFALSVAIPALNEGDRLPPLLSDLAEIGAQRPHPSTEFIVLDDGSAPAHVERERSAVEAADRAFIAASVPHRMRFVASPRNLGKGAAIRRAWAESSPGVAWLAFLDADGAVHGGEFWRLAGKLGSDAPFDVLAGSRILMAGRSIRRSLFRHLQGRVFATLADRTLRLGFYDTQCGVKFFRAQMLRPELPRLRENRWLLDLELLAVMKARGATCVEEPIDWADPGHSKVVFGLDPLRMLLGLRRIRRRVTTAVGDAA